MIFGAGLRFDDRFCAATGLLAAAQWMSLIAWAQFAGLADAALQDGRFYGDISLGGQVEELVAIAVATTFALVFVHRAGALRLSSIRDGLTGLLNRAYLEERLELELERMARQRRPLALAILDLDLFKPVNDTFGHPAGDAVLRAAAARIRRHVRRTGRDRVVSTSPAVRPASPSLLPAER